MMTVANILEQKSKGVITLPPDCTMQQVLNLLHDKKIGAVVVAEGQDVIRGIVSERDIVRAIATKGADALAEPASKHMSSPVVTCSETDSIGTVMEKMTDGRFRHIPVERQGKMIGIISIGDVVKKRIEDAEREAAEMRNYIASA
jgi:CBS domain-containing protein